MAFLWKHPKSKYFIAGFYDVDGTRRNRSTRTTKQKEAKKIAEAFEEAANKRRSAKQVRAAITALHREVNGTEIPSHSLRQFSTSWLDTKRPEVGTATLDFYSGTIKKFLSFLGEKADEEMTELSKNDIVGFRNHEAKTLASRTVNHDLKCLRMLFRAAKEEQIINEDPTEFVRITKKDKPVTRIPFTLEQLRLLLDAADDEMKSLIRFGLYSGQRLGDLAMLSWENVDLKRNEIRLITRKTNRKLTIPIAPPLLEHIRQLAAQGASKGPIHKGAHASVSSTSKTSTLSKQFGDLMAKAELRPKRTPAGPKKLPTESETQRTSLSFHSLRHTAVTFLQEAGIPQAVVMELVGHDSEQMSHHYTHVGQDALKKAAEALPIL